MLSLLLTIDAMIESHPVSDFMNEARMGTGTIDALVYATPVSTKNIAGTRH
jgi:hypothetical protein